MNVVKKIRAIMLAAVMAIGFSSCGTKEPVPERDTAEKASYESLGDVLGSGKVKGWSNAEGRFTIVTVDGDTVMRYSSALTEETAARLDEVDFMADDRDEQYAEILSDVAIEKEEELSAGIPGRDVLDGYIGMTGEELADRGFTCFGYMLDGEHPTFYMSKGLFDYLVTFNEHLDYTEEMADMEYMDIAKRLTVKSIEYYGVSDLATDPNVTE